jgi:hypothetical protein
VLNILLLEISQNKINFGFLIRAANILAQLIFVSSGLIEAGSITSLGFPKRF